MTQQEKEKKLFLREATGLVKEASFVDVLQFNAVSLTGIAIISGTTLLLTLMTYGDGIWEAITLGFVFSLFVSLTYYILAITIPRSGGDYIYISRLLHPALGFLSAGLTGIFGTLVLAATFGATVWVSAGLGPLLSALGLNALAGQVTGTTFLTIVGILTTLFFGTLLAFGGNKAFFRLNNVLYGIAILGALVGGAAFLSVGHDGFVRLFDSFASSYGTNSSDIMTTATSAGFKPPGSDGWSVLVGSALLFTSYYWVTQSSYLGGEVRNAKRNQFWGMIGSAVFWFVVTLVVILALYYTVGPRLISSASYLNYFNPNQWKIPVVSFFALYANIAANNPAVAVLISLAFIFGYMTVTGWSFIIFSRAVFALSFDRILPSSLADINERYHTPIKAYMVFAALTIVFLILLTFPSTAVTIYTYGVGLNVVYMISFFLTSIALMVLPYRYRQLYESSCPVKSKMAGVPVVSIIGAVSAIFLVLYEYIFITYNAYFGVTTGFLEVMVGFVVFFIVLYFVIISYRKRQGLDIDLVYKEIPPE